MTITSYCFSGKKTNASVVQCNENEIILDNNWLRIWKYFTRLT